MKSFLEELYFGNLAPNIGVRGCNAIGRISEIENTLTQLLDGKEKNLFLEFVNAWDELNGKISVEKFICGFTLGSSMMAEVYETRGSYCKEKIA